MRPGRIFPKSCPAGVSNARALAVYCHSQRNSSSQLSQFQSAAAVAVAVAAVVASGARTGTDADAGRHGWTD